MALSTTGRSRLLRFLRAVKPRFLSLPRRFFLMEITYNGGRARRSRCSANHPRHAQELIKVRSTNLDNVQFLLAHGASVNVPYDGDNPLYMALDSLCYTWWPGAPGQVRSGCECTEQVELDTAS